MFLDHLGYNKHRTTQRPLVRMPDTNRASFIPGVRLVSQSPLHVECSYRCAASGSPCDTCQSPPTPTATTTETYVGCWSRTSCGQCVPGDAASSIKTNDPNVE